MLSRVNLVSFRFWNFRAWTCLKNEGIRGNDPGLDPMESDIFPSWWFNHHGENHTSAGALATFGNLGRWDVPWRWKKVSKGLSLGGGNSIILFLPKNWGRWTHFDGRILFKWVGPTTKQQFFSSQKLSLKFTKLTLFEVILRWYTCHTLAIFTLSCYIFIFRLGGSFITFIWGLP